MQRKQAVLVIHGIGDQRPMQTLAGFVDRVWSRDANGHAIPTRRRWFRPDSRKNLDLFQIVAVDDASDMRTDFYELYWAHLMEGTRFASVWAWFWNALLLRPAADMPPAMREAKVWAKVILFVCVAPAVVAISSGAIMLSGLLSGRALGTILAWSSAVTVLFAVILLVLDRSLICPYIGDAARYLRNTPDNVAARQSIRALGLQALEDLHASDRCYERIIVVGHSLGSIIGYDILRYAFADRTREVRFDAIQPPPQLAVWDAAAAALKPAGPDQDYMAAQRELCRTLPGKTWRVTDFVTLGSPLAYARILLAESNGEFIDFVGSRRLPSNPPVPDDGRDPARPPTGFYAWTESSTGQRWLSPHHAAMFAFTRWSNLYFPASHVIFGDIVGGPIDPGLGLGIKNVAIDCLHRFGHRIFSHTSYWSSGGTHGTPSHINAVQDALDIGDRNTAAGLPRDTRTSRGGRLSRPEP